MLKKICGAVGGIAGALAVSAAAYLPFVIADARKNYRDKCDYLLILGGNVIGADTPSPQLSARIKAAGEYLKENPSVIAVACGGCFRDGQKKSEAEIIASDLIKQGIEESRLILEDKSATTYENFEFGTKIISEHAEKPLEELKIAFLSSDYHIHRATLIAEQSGIKNCGRVSCHTSEKAVSRYLREYIVAYELLYKILIK